MNTDKKPHFFERPSGLFTAIGLVCVIWATWALVLSFMPLNKEWSLATQGQFGDMFGSLNTLFAGLAFAALLHTVFIQRAELRDTQKEVEDSRRLAQAQRFESAFFQLIATFNSIVDSFDRHKRIARSDNYLTISGRDVLSEDTQVLFTYLSEKASAMPEGNRIEIVRSAYEIFYDGRETRLAHYFRMLYRILRWIELAPKDDQIFYAKTIRAQLSSQEVILLMYNCLYPYGEKMKPLVEKFSLLKHVPRIDVIPEEDRMFFAPSAFQENS